MDKLLRDNVIIELCSDRGYDKNEIKKLSMKELENLYEKEYGRIALLSLKEKLRFFKVSVCSEIYYGGIRR